MLEKMAEGKLRFGLFDIMQVLEQTSSQRAYAAHLKDAVVADEAGLDYYFVAERHFMPLYRSPAPSVWLAAVAAKTKRIRLGSLAYTLPLHNPVRLAEEVSMLDHLSDGRMEVGVGLGHRVEELVALGIDPAIRQPLLLEGIVLLTRAWRGEPFDHPGQAYQFENIYVEAPVQRPHPPLWFAGNDPQAIGWAARNGLSVAVGFQPNERLVVPTTAFREADVTGSAAAAGNGPQLALMRHLYVAESDERAMDEMTKDVMEIGGHFTTLPRGIQGEPPGKLTRDEARASVQHMLDTDVIIGGGPETCAQRLAQTARQLQLDVFLANPYLTGVDARRIRRTIRLLAATVGPRVNELLNEN
jgi:alkanesulfonate monooxygenase SsuD/methylene tetrahydromethanopterin reductase-like flavin-dependent oxidoreductase (luciferase family)